MKIKIISIVIVLLALSLLFSGCTNIGEAKGGKPSKPKAQCSDRIDNDGDNLCDYLGCWLGM